MAYKFHDNEELSCINSKNFDASILPPCESELRQHFKKTAYIANVWRNAHLRCPTELSLNECGWEENDGTYDFKWFEGDQLPASVNDVILEHEGNRNSDNTTETPTTESEQEDDDDDDETHVSDDDDDDEDDDYDQMMKRKIYTYI
ncbi:hypothetical protein RF55_7437 [Lasius niger]|uniref:Uncharacterized protein n=1 Tax=Lasius niger TaxID=67767 RepID=A0A0J7NJ84_LASNI|nr:hypothetical protein RF55_7437 [Lasius niger]